MIDGTASQESRQPPLHSLVRPFFLVVYMPGSLSEILVNYFLLSKTGSAVGVCSSNLLVFINKDQASFITKVVFAAYFYFGHRSSLR